MEPIIILIAILFGAAFGVVQTIAMWKIFEKCGWNGAFSLLLFLPLINVVVLLMVAFSDTPTRRPAYQYAPPPPPAG